MMESALVALATRAERCKEECLRFYLLLLLFFGGQGGGFKGSWVANQRFFSSTFFRSRDLH